VKAASLFISFLQLEIVVDKKNIEIKNSAFEIIVEFILI
jgi:hypothetical protein